MHKTHDKLKLGVLVSGSGSNLQAILDACVAGTLDAQVSVVIANKPDAYGLERARAADIPAYGLAPQNYADAVAFDTAVMYELLRHQVDYVVMAGYMRKVTSHILDGFPNRVLNIHPSMLPAFPGAHGLRDALAAGVTTTGVTVHFANEVFDEGPIIMQEAVAIKPDDTLESLAERVHAVEHVLYPKVLQLIAQGRVSVEDSTVIISPPLSSRAPTRDLTRQ